MSRREALTNTDVPITTDPIPDAVLKLAKAYSKGQGNPSEKYEASVQVWRDFVDRYRSTKNKRHRTVMQQVANYVVGEGIRIDFGLTEAMDSALTEERRARRGLYPEALYTIVGDGIADGLDWKSINIQTGTSSYRKSDDHKSLRDRYEEWTATEILGSYIAIGKHTLFVGKTVPRILEALEERYGLDFKQLEQLRKKSAK